MRCYEITGQGSMTVRYPSAAYGEMSATLGVEAPCVYRQTRQ
jgi:hypothetical protein